MRKIQIKNSSNVADDLLYQKVNFVGNVFFSGLSPTENRILCELIRVGESGMVNLTINLSKSITKALNLNDNTLNVSLSRIEGKGAIKKNKRLISFQPVFGDIMWEDKYLIVFGTPIIKVEKVNIMGMELERWTHKSCIADFGIGSDFATLYTINSICRRKGHATELLTEAKRHYETQNKLFGGSIALNDNMRNIYVKLGIKEYNED